MDEQQAREDTVWGVLSVYRFGVFLVLIVTFVFLGVLLDTLTAIMPTSSASGPSTLEVAQRVLDHHKATQERLHASAQLLYDFAKIALGALIASIGASPRPGRSGKAVETNGPEHDHEEMQPEGGK